MDDFDRAVREHEAERERWEALTPKQREAVRRERAAERARQLEEMTKRRCREYQQRRDP